MIGFWEKQYGKLVYLEAPEPTQAQLALYQKAKKTADAKKLEAMMP